VIRFLATADLHLTSRPDDEYRWTVLPWLAKRARLLNVDCVFVVGDLTHGKDAHPAKLVNRLVDALADFPCPVHVLMGNHDYADPDHPFFRFLNRAGVNFIHAPYSETMYGARVRFFPHARAWKGQFGRHRDYSAFDFLFIHQPVRGAKTEGGGRMTDGVPAARFDSVGRYAVAGDIHVPQTIRKVVYCGAPHPVRFGDDFTPRVLHFDGEALKPVPRHTVRKAVLTLSSADALEASDLGEGDMLKVIAHLKRRDFGDYPALRKAVADICRARRISLRGVELRERARLRISRWSRKPVLASASPAETLRAFARARGLGDGELAFGLRLLPENG